MILTKRIQIAVFLLLVMGLCRVSVSVEPNGETETSLTGQLKINRAALLNPSMDEQIRIDTALELLRNEDQQARAILLEVLAANDNTAAQIIVCKAIIQSRGWGEVILRPKEFLQPLTAILKQQDGGVAKFAAQASLIFEYRQLQPYLMDIIENPALPMQSRLNAIYAMQIRPDKEAVSQLLVLLDNEDKQIAAAAREALQVWLPLATDEQSWRKNLKKLERMSRVEILKEWVTAQDGRIRQLEMRLKNYQQLYIASQDEIYGYITDGGEKAELLVAQLGSEYSDIRSWAIQKVDIWLKSGSKMPLDILSVPLIKLISDEEISVRLAAVKLLGLLSNVNSADKLLVQLRVEQVPEVRKELLAALGQVCNYALSPGAEFSVNASVRIETLEIVSKYFDGDDSYFAAKIVRKLLLQNGLEKEQAGGYFELIADSFEKGSSDTELKGQLLSEMSRLCSQDSFYRQRASEIFGDIFLKAIDDRDVTICEPAVEGFIKTDRNNAFGVLRDKGFTGHSSSKIRKALIELAGQIGGKDDTEWLFTVLTSTGTDAEERKLAWEAMSKLSQDFPAMDIIQLAVKYDAAMIPNAAVDTESRCQRALNLFETAERKIINEGSKELLGNVRLKLAACYEKCAQYDMAAKYYGLLLAESLDPNERDALTGAMLGVHLMKGGQFEQVGQLVTNQLLTKDLGKTDTIVVAIGEYLHQASEAESSTLINALKAIKTESPRPLWQGQLLKWAAPATIVEPNKPQ